MTSPSVSNSITRELERTPEMAAVSAEWGRGSCGDLGSFVAREMTPLQQISGVQGTESPAYLDRIDKSLADTRQRVVPACAKFFVPGRCEHGHEFFRMTACGFEWCAECRDGMHGRRISRWLPKVQQLESMGYLVVTIPPEDRGRFRTREELAGAGKLATAVVRRTWARGLRRWHWMGSQGTVYHPHLNYLVDGGRVSKAQLRQLRRELASAMGLSREPVVNYSYTRKPGQMWHHLSYVTRATFLERSWDEELASELYGFRNVAWWGAWAGPPAWSLDDLGGDPHGDQGGPQPGELAAVGKLEEGTCPIDGTRIRWHHAVHIDNLPTDLVDLGGGYWLNTWSCGPGP